MEKATGSYTFDSNLNKSIPSIWTAAASLAESNKLSSAVANGCYSEKIRFTAQRSTAGKRKEEEVAERSETAGHNKSTAP